MECGQLGDYLLIARRKLSHSTSCTWNAKYVSKPIYTSQRIGTAPLILDIVFKRFRNGYLIEVSFDSDVPSATPAARNCACSIPWIQQKAHRTGTRELWHERWHCSSITLANINFYRDLRTPKQVTGTRDRWHEERGTRKLKKYL